MSRHYYFGEWIDKNSVLTSQEVAEIAVRGRAQAKVFANYPVESVLSLLDKVGKQWANPDYRPRKQLEELLPGSTGFSLPMIQMGMQEIPFVLNAENLRKKLKAELGNTEREGQWSWGASSKTALCLSPLGVILHVLSGNVFLVGMGSLVEGLITGNVSILKRSSGEGDFMEALVRSVQELDTDGVVSKSFAILDYPSSAVDVIAAWKKEVDALVVWGGETAVKAYRNDLPARSRFIVFGPKISLALVTTAGLNQFGTKETAKRLADELAIWDQNACTAPQVCFAEGKETAMALAKALAQAMAQKEIDIPAGPADPQTAVEIQKLRSVAEIAEARHTGKVYESPGNVAWTVIVDEKLGIESSPLHRTIRIVAASSLNSIYQEVETVRGYLQTVGVMAADDELQSVATSLSHSGAVRILELGQMAGGEIEDPHDGAYDLPHYFNFTFARFLSSKNWVDSEINGRLRRLIEVARNAPFYRERLENLTINGVEDLALIPTLKRGEMEANLPPQGNGLCSGRWEPGGYVSRSGGSTGEPKFSIYDGHDWEQMIASAGEVFKAAGIRRGDRVANCMLAGDLYGSFVSFDHINARLGVQTFAFADKLEPDLFLRIWRTFHINVIQAIPAVMVPLLRAAKNKDPKFSIEKVVFAGAPLQPSDKKWMRERLGVKQIASIIGANDGGQIGFQCESLSGAFHHAVDDFNYLEVIDDEGKPCATGKAGRLVITSLLKYAYPLIRYEIGDRGRIVDNGRCACGRSGRLFEYLGRADDMICVGILNLRYADFQTALEAEPISALQIVAENPQGNDDLVVKVESEGNCEGLSDRLRARVLSQVAKVQSNLDSGALRSLRIEIHPLGELPRNPRSGKIRTLIDARQ